MVASLIRNISCQSSHRIMNVSSCVGKNSLSRRPICDFIALESEIKDSKHVLVLTGAGISAESGVPTFRGAGGYWRKWKAQSLATPEAFKSNPSLVWEFYHYRRQVMLSKLPNPAHYALKELQKHFEQKGNVVDIVTQNIDGLHQASGAKNIVELHGSLFKTRCTKCGNIEVNKNSPICPALQGKGMPEHGVANADIPIDLLPHCKKKNCNGLLRPHVVWFGESLDDDVLEKVTNSAFKKCDICLIIGTSSVVYPAAMFAPAVADRGVTVAEFNMEETPATRNFKYHFQGSAGSNLPRALSFLYT